MKLLTYLYKLFAGSSRVPTMILIVNYYCCCLSHNYSLLVNNANKVLCLGFTFHCQKRPDLKMSQPCACLSTSPLTHYGLKVINFHMTRSIVDKQNSLFLIAAKKW